MRISTSVNGATGYVASLSGAGYLSVHVNLSSRPKEGERTAVLGVEGFDTNSPEETVSVKWPEVVLSCGDVIQLRVLEEGPGDPPAVRKSSAKSPGNLLSNETLAKELLSLCDDFERKVFDLLERAKDIEPAEEHRKLTRAVGHLAVDLGQHILSPIYRRHPSLIPEDVKGELL